VFTWDAKRNPLVFGVGDCVFESFVAVFARAIIAELRQGTKRPFGPPRGLKPPGYKYWQLAIVHRSLAIFRKIANGQWPIANGHLFFFFPHEFC